jgi:tetratricopeptide (TPR) repeat protein
MLPALAALVFATEGLSFFRSRRLLYAALFAFAGLSIYVYLPLAASRSPVMNWGDPRTLERIWWHVSGRQYQVNFSFSFFRIGEFVTLAFREFGRWWMPFGIVLALVGLIRLFKRDLAMFWFLILAIGCDVAYGLSYEIAEDKDAYYLPAFIAMTMAAGMGVHWLVSSARSGRVPVRGGQFTMAIIVLVVPVVSLASNLPYNNRSHYFIAKDYVENILRTVEPGGMVLTADWQVYSPMFYMQQIERQRPDVISIDIKQLRRSWYYEYLASVYPRMIEQSRDKVDAFLEDLKAWEHDPELYNRDLMLNKRIGARFYEMILAFISNHIQSGPVYLTRDVATGMIGNAVDPEDAELRESLSKSYQLVPKGLVFQVFHKGGIQDSDDEPQLVTRGVADGTIKFEDDDVVKLKVLPAYVTMLYSRGRQLAAYGRHERAIELFRRSLELNPDFTAAKQAINESLNAIRKSNTNKPQ